jgi:hypothetical protein
MRAGVVTDLPAVPGPQGPARAVAFIEMELVARSIADVAEDRSDRRPGVVARGVDLGPARARGGDPPAPEVARGGVALDRRKGRLSPGRSRGRSTRSLPSPVPSGPLWNHAVSAFWSHATTFTPELGWRCQSPHWSKSRVTWPAPARRRLDVASSSTSSPVPVRPVRSGTSRHGAVAPPKFCCHSGPRGPSASTSLQSGRTARPGFGACPGGRVRETSGCPGAQRSRDEGPSEARTAAVRGRA